MGPVCHMDRGGNFTNRSNQNRERFSRNEPQFQHLNLNLSIMIGQDVRQKLHWTWKKDETKGEQATTTNQQPNTDNRLDSLMYKRRRGMSAFFGPSKNVSLKSWTPQLDLPSRKFAPNSTCLRFSVSLAQKIFYTVSLSTSVGPNNLLLELHTGMKENGRKRNIDKFPAMATTIHGISGSPDFFFTNSGRMPTSSTIPVYYVVALLSV